MVAVGAVPLRTFALRATRKEEKRSEWTLFLDAECRLLSREELKQSSPTVAMKTCCSEHSNVEGMIPVMCRLTIPYHAYI